MSQPRHARLSARLTEEESRRLDRLLSIYLARWTPEFGRPPTRSSVFLVAVLEGLKQLEQFNQLEQSEQHQSD